MPALPGFAAAPGCGRPDCHYTAVLAAVHMTHGGPWSASHDRVTGLLSPLCLTTTSLRLYCLCNIHKASQQRRGHVVPSPQYFLSPSFLRDNIAACSQALLTTSRQPTFFYTLVQLTPSHPHPGRPATPPAPRNFGRHTRPLQSARTRPAQAFYLAAIFFSMAATCSLSTLSDMTCTTKRSSVNLDPLDSCVHFGREAADLHLVL